MMEYYLLTISVTTAVFTVYDKIASKHFRRNRVPEKVLLGMGFLGGAAAEYVTMKIIRHKTRHKNFMIGLPAMIILHIALLAAYYYFI